MIGLFWSVALLAEVAPPTFRYLPDSRVVLESSMPDAVIRYTFEDRDPDKSAGVYFGPVDVPVGRVLRARVFSASHEATSSVLLIAGRPQPSTVVEVTQNRDWKNWTKKMSPAPEDRDDKIAVTKPRPGHADLAGVLKYDRSDVRDILERASARDTVSRTAVGSFCKQLLAPFGIRVMGYIRSIGNVTADLDGLSYEEAFFRSEESAVRTADSEAEAKMIALIEECKKEGNTLGGIFEVVALGLPPGLGAHTQWDRKLDARLAGALMSNFYYIFPEVGFSFSLIAYVAVALGGFGSIPGSFVAGIIIGVVDEKEPGAPV